ncbi:septum formation protein Maf [Acidipila sp. EB88]|nr:septum formation protein Maf [Acidipila sp. EB88]
MLLASASPRRSQLLQQAGFQFTVQSTDADERVLAGEDAVALAVRLARLKAEAASASAGVVVLGADTVVAAPNGELLGKPVDAQDAARMLRLLSGNCHQVVTGVCVRSADATAGRVEVAASLTSVFVQTLSDGEIARYVAGGEPMGKAGAYAIQGRAARWIRAIQGDYSNVVGLPLALACDMLAGFGILPE